ncbi:ribosome maturation factor RimM [Propionivibrio limicola]|uniref:ribosome maturation factor RimM n=1 Tax=Propionivibrio limicola TaxID=167645 RepID=UPI001FE26537|nr:ribosome maturation factor RimM [Propionivibrio limicola]
MSDLLDSVEAPLDIVVLGKVVAPYGLRGAVKVFPFADDAPSWAKLPYWWVGSDEASSSEWQIKQLASCKVSGGVVVAQFEDVSDRNAAEAMQGRLVGVSRSELPKTGKDEYYWGDLIGLDVVNTQNQSLGKVLGLIETPANDVLRVGVDEGKERLLPFVATVVLDVDRESGRILVDWGVDW